jgi:UDP-N-acetylmuramate-alanine ligase
MLSEEINRNKTESLPIENTEKIIEIISKLDENHISITVGAGDIYKIYDDQKLKLLLQI